MNISEYFRWQAGKGVLATIKYRVCRYLYAIVCWACCRLKADCFDKCDDVDVLMLSRSHSSEWSPEWVSKLCGELGGLRIAHEKASRDAEILKRGQLEEVGIAAPFEYYMYAAYACYLVKKYNPKVVVIDCNGAKYTPFLRSAINECGGLLVHVAHSIPTTNYRKFCLCDIDYSFVYGQSSLDALQAMPVRYGKSRYILSGSIAISERNAVSGKNVIAEPFCVLLGSGPSYEGSGAVTGVYRDLIKWSFNSGVKVLFKPHPRSGTGLWDSLVKDHAAELTTGCLSAMHEARGAQFAVAAYTNAVLDVADLGVPVIWMAAKDEVDHFQVERFFLPRAVDDFDLVERVNEVSTNQDHYQNQARLFREYHLGTADSPAKLISDVIRKLVNGDDDFDYQELAEK